MESAQRQKIKQRRRNRLHAIKTPRRDRHNAKTMLNHDSPQNHHTTTPTYPTTRAKAPPANPDANCRPPRICRLSPDQTRKAQFGGAKFSALKEGGNLKNPSFLHLLNLGFLAWHNAHNDFAERVKALETEQERIRKEAKSKAAGKPRAQAKAIREREECRLATGRLDLFHDELVASGKEVERETATVDAFVECFRSANDARMIGALKACADVNSAGKVKVGFVKMELELNYEEGDAAGLDESRALCGLFVRRRYWRCKVELRRCRC